MKKIYLATFIVLLSTNAWSQLFIPDSLYGIKSRSIIVTTPGETFTKFLLQPDGLIISAGYDYNINQNDFHIDLARYDQCGILDTTFGVAGVSRAKFEQRNTGYGFALQPDGKILSVGQQAPSNSGSQQIPYVARFLSDGNPDTTFGTNGSNSLRFDPVSSGSFNSVYALSDGRVICIGGSSGNINGGMKAAGIMRFLPNGTLDLSYNGTGKLQYTAVNADHLRTYGHLLQNGNMIVAGYYYDPSNLLHYFSMEVDSTGSINNNYGNNGVFTYGADMTGKVATTIQPDEKIIMAGDISPAPTGISVIRLNTDGTLDSTFGVSGNVNINISPMTVSKLKVMSTGKIMVMGGYASGFGVGCAVMLNTDGTIDSLFATNGFMLFDLNGMTGTHNLGDVLELPGNRLLAGGSYSEFASVRYILASNVPHITYQHPNLSATGNGTYQWYLDSVLIPGATASIHDPVALGSYQVEITDDLGCTYMSDPFVILTVGINKNEITGFTAYPNPFTDALIIESENAEDVYISLTDASGRVIREEFSLTNSRVHINTSDISNGLYFLKVRAEGRISSVKVVK